jgi:hypothetical protein
MRYETAVRKHAKLQSEVRSVFVLARKFHQPFDTVLQHLQDRVYGSKDYAKLPRWARCQLRGYIDAQYESLNDHCLEWRVRLDGKLIKGSQVPEGRWADVEKGAFVWQGTSNIWTDARDNDV